MKWFNICVEKYDKYINRFLFQDHYGSVIIILIIIGAFSTYNALASYTEKGMGLDMFFTLLALFLIGVNTGMYIQTKLTKKSQEEEI